MTVTITNSTTVPRSEEILTPDAMQFVASLHRQFGHRRDDLLVARAVRRSDLARGSSFGFLPETAAIREGNWRVPEAPRSLQDRRVEITGPASPAKMAINALNSGAQGWLADLEDASTPRWFSVIDSQVNLKDATQGTLTHVSNEGRQYELRTDAPLAVPIVRPRGWHMAEVNLNIDGAPAIAALVDFGLHFFHNAAQLAATGRGPFYYLPKMESHNEARLWHEIFTASEQQLEVPHGTVRATALIETIPAAFEMDEILFELGEHAAGLNAGRWDYLFSFIKHFSSSGDQFILPDRASITMTAPFMHAYTELLVSTCHRRGAFAIGGMAAFVPDRKDVAVTKAAIAKVREDKAREAHDGFDGSWVAHPDLVAVCREVFDAALGERPNQLHRQRDDVQVSATDLLNISSAGGQVTESGLRSNLYVAVAYTAAWLSGNGAAAIDHLMEDAATAEISRAQVWQHVHNAVVYADTGNTATADLVVQILAEETSRLRGEVDDTFYRDYVEPASRLIEELSLADQLAEFLTTRASELLTR